MYSHHLKDGINKKQPARKKGCACHRSNRGRVCYSAYWLVDKLTDSSSFSYDTIRSISLLKAAEVCLYTERWKEAAADGSSKCQFVHHFSDQVLERTAHFGEMKPYAAGCNGYALNRVGEPVIYDIHGSDIKRTGLSSASFSLRSSSAARTFFSDRAEWRWQAVYKLCLIQIYLRLAILQRISFCWKLVLWKIKPPAIFALNKVMILSKFLRRRGCVQFAELDIVKISAESCRKRHLKRGLHLHHDPTTSECRPMAVLKPRPTNVLRKIANLSMTRWIIAGLA